MQYFRILQSTQHGVWSRANKIFQEKFTILIPTICHFIAAAYHHLSHCFFLFDQFYLKRAIIIIADTDLPGLVARERNNKFITASFEL